MRTRGRRGKFSSDSFTATYEPGCNLAPDLRVVGAEPIKKMKTTLSFLALVSLSLTASAAASEVPAEVHLLPAVTVEIPRFTDAEKAINASLAALCANAGKLAALEAELRLPRPATIARTASALAPVAVALREEAPPARSDRS